MEDALHQWIKKIKALQTPEREGDLSRDEDLAIGIMNLISLEEHFYFSAMKTNNEQYLALGKEIRQLRIQAMKQLVKNPQGEEWCISKHLLAAAMRFYEVGTKVAVQSPEEAKRYYEIGFSCFSLFFGLQLGVVSQAALQKKIAFSGKKKQTVDEDQKGLKKISAVIKEIVNCCKEW